MLAQMPKRQSGGKATTLPMTDVWQSGMQEISAIVPQLPAWLDCSNLFGPSAACMEDHFCGSFVHIFCIALIGADKLC